MQPRPKKYCRLKPPIPLPIIKEPDGGIYKFKSKFMEYNVVIENEREMKDIISMGYFGKANFSRSYPSFTPSKNHTAVLRKRQFERRKILGRKFGDRKLNKKCIVVPDSEEEGDYFVNLKPQYETDCSGLKETVHLSFEEAYFLHQCVGCLDVYKENKPLCNEECWSLFKSSDRNFVSNYVVYCYYRAKNWVVKPGIKFGGDYLLYKQGPPFYHASYLVIIDIVDQKLERIKEKSRRSMNSIHLQGLNRLCETAGKELIICQVKWPEGLENVGAEDIKKFEVKEILRKRWLPSVERQHEDRD